MNATNNGADRGAENWKDYQPGSLVACVDDVSKWPNGAIFIAHGNKLPEKGKIYTIREQFFYDDGLQIRLVEIVNPVLPYLEEATEMMFHFSAFRPVKSSRIDSFKSFLIDPGKVRSVKSVSPVRYVDGGLV